MTKAILPRVNQTGANEWSDVESNDSALAEVINGQLDNENIKKGAGITDEKLASPNNAVYRPLLTAQSGLYQDIPAATRILGFGGIARASGSNALQGLEVLEMPPILSLDAADYPVSGKTHKLRIRCWVAPNATKPTITFTFGLYPLTVAGGADSLTYTLGTVVTGSTKAIAEPSASTLTAAVSGDFDLPANGPYALGFVQSAQMTNNSVALIGAQLQTRHV